MSIIGMRYEVIAVMHRAGVQACYVIRPDKRTSKPKARLGFKHKHSTLELQRLAAPEYATWNTLVWTLEEAAWFLGYSVTACRFLNSAICIPKKYINTSNRKIKTERITGRLVSTLHNVIKMDVVFIWLDGYKPDLVQHESGDGQLQQLFSSPFFWLFSKKSITMHGNMNVNLNKSYRQYVSTAAISSSGSSISIIAHYLLSRITRHMLSCVMSHSRPSSPFFDEHYTWEGGGGWNIVWD
jgi:hypothetical protein